MKKSSGTPRPGEKGKKTDESQDKTKFRKKKKQKKEEEALQKKATTGHTIAKKLS